MSKLIAGLLLVAFAMPLWAAEKAPSVIRERNDRPVAVERDDVKTKETVESNRQTNLSVKQSVEAGVTVIRGR